MNRRANVGELAFTVDGSMSRALSETHEVSEAMTAPALSEDDSSAVMSAMRKPQFAGTRTFAEDKKLKTELAALEDAELLRLFQEGIEPAFYVIFERRHKEIFTHCYRMCNGDTEKANDAFQDTFVKVFTRKDLFTDATNGRAWLYRIATNTCLNAHRYDKRHPREELDDTMRASDPQLMPDFGTEQDSLRSAIERAVGKLPMELREPFMLRELDEFSYEEVAEQLNISVAACRQRVYRAKQILREELEEMVTGEAPKKKKRKW